MKLKNGFFLIGSETSPKKNCNEFRKRNTHLTPRAKVHFFFNK